MTGKHILFFISLFHNIVVLSTVLGLHMVRLKSSEISTKLIVF